MGKTKSVELIGHIGHLNDDDDSEYVLIPVGDHILEKRINEVLHDVGVFGDSERDYIETSELPLVRLKIECEVLRRRWYRRSPRKKK